jgi:hypothetical protein
MKDIHELIHHFNFEILLLICIFVPHFLHKGLSDEVGSNPFDVRYSWVDSSVAITLYDSVANIFTLKGAKTLF